MSISQKDLENIVATVVKNLQGEKTCECGGKCDGNCHSTTKFMGVLNDMDTACNEAYQSHLVLRELTVEKKEEIISYIRKFTLEEADIMAKMGVLETGMGNVADKILKHRYVAMKTPGTEDLVTEAITGDKGLTLYEMAPYGVIAAITPSTNPSETVICNSIGMIAGSNTVVFNPHPNAKDVANYAVDLVNRAVKAAGVDINLAFSVEKPTMETSDIMLKHKYVKMICCTGGPGVVKTVLSSGKKAIGAGAGNPPVVVDETADIVKAGRDIVLGASFDNNLPCIAEKEVFVVNSVADDLISAMINSGAYLIDYNQMKALEEIVLTTNKKGIKTVSRDFVGRDAYKFLNALGVEAPEGTKLLICEASEDDLFVKMELMMPILPIVRVKNVDEAIKLAVIAEEGNRHTAHMHSKNVDNLTKFARAVETTIFVKNAPSYAGIGVGGEGHCTFTIAGPTGEGLTSARSFTRKRRCVMTESFRIV